jgi:adenine-specific DNA-methyltransferase
MNVSMRELKTLIVDGLSAFNNGSLLENATSLLNTLGYYSDKSLDLSPNSADNFLDTFDGKNIFQKEKALLESWRSIDIVFQLTDEEIYSLGSGQRSLQFDAQNKIDNKIYQSYLFVALQLKKGHYTRTDLANITREINKLFPMPVFILFKNGEYLTLSVINRRLHKRDASKDVLEKVTLIKDIRFVNPHRAHIEILYDLSFDILYDRHRFTSFVGLHEAWRKILDNEDLNKRFYRELANWYFWALREVTFPSQNNIPQNTRNPINVIRMITRIIFVWFIKEKGLIPESIFTMEKAAELLQDFTPDSSSYYKAVLQNLFFATLSTNMGDRMFRGERRFKGINDHYGVHNVYRYKSMFNQSNDIVKIFKDTPFLNL